MNVSFDFTIFKSYNFTAVSLVLFCLFVLGGKNSNKKTSPGKSATGGLMQKTDNSRETLGSFVNGKRRKGTERNKTKKNVSKHRILSMRE